MLKETPRLLPAPSRSFFLFGPRGIGKSTWLRHKFPRAATFDLLDQRLFFELSRDPRRLEALIAAQKSDLWIVLDEIQKIPALLEEVHRLLDKGGHRFALCGSSARKLRRGGADLLAGRALTLNLEAFSYGELRKAFDIKRAIAFGTLPQVVHEPLQAKGILYAYVNTYVREEIKEEGLVRNVAPFLRFLQVAGMLNGQTVNASNISREAAVPRASVDQYFSILVDTLLGHFLPAYQPAIKVRERAHPKFYWFDPGVARAAAGLLDETPDRLWQGWALETLIFHELRTYFEARQIHPKIAYYQTSQGSEIDFIVETHRRRPDRPARVVCFEVKLAERWDRSWDRPMRELAQSGGIKVDRLIGIYMGTHRYHFDRVDVFPVHEFLEELHAGKIIH